MTDTAKVIVVTGGARGIGKAIAEKHLENGWKAVIMDINEKAMREWTDGNPDVLGIVCDVTSLPQIESARDRILEVFGKMDAVINNSGWWPASRDPLESYPEDYWMRTLNTNVNGTYLVTQVMGGVMIKARKGCFVNLSSIAAIGPIPGSGAYCPSKAAIAMLTKLTALEWGKYGIRANALCPGQIVTEMTKVRFADPEIAKQRTEIIPLGYLGTPQDIAKACFFLTSDDAAYITGETLLVDGGLSLNTVERLGRS